MTMILDPAYLPYWLFAVIALITAAALMLVRDLVFGGAEAGAVSLQQLPAHGLRPPRTAIGRLDRWFDRLLLSTGYAFSPLAAFLAAVAVGLALGGAVYVWRTSELLAVIVFLVGTVLVIAWYAWAGARRRTAMQTQLPEIMDLMARAVRAGESLDQAFTLVGDTQRDPLSVEFRRCSRQLEMGLSLDVAMQSFMRRVPIAEASIFAAAITVQRRTGGNLPLTMERLASVFRDRLAYRRQYRAATAAGRTSTIVIVAAVALLVTYLLIWRPDHFRSFLESDAGKIMLTAAVILQGLGLWWIIRLLRPER